MGRGERGSRGGVTEREKRGKEKLKLFPSATNLSNFLLLKAALWTFTKDDRISAAAPRAAVSKPCMLSCRCHCAPTERKKKIVFWQAAGSQTASPVLLASHQGFVRQACSEPRAFKTPIMQQDSAGQKEQECFRQSCGHTGIIHSSVALWIFCESYKQKGGKRPAKAARSFDNWELYKFRKSSQEDLKFFFFLLLFFYSPFPSFFFPLCLPHCVLSEKPRAKVPLRR